MTVSIPLLFNIKPGVDQASISKNDSNNRVTVSLQSPIDLSLLKNPTLSIVNFTCFYTMPNVDQGSEVKFQYSNDGLTWTDLDSYYFDQGLYSTEGVNSALSVFVEESKDLQDQFTDLTLKITPNYNTEKVDVKASSNDLSNTNQLKIVIDNAKLAETIGFTDMVFTSTSTHSAPNKAEFNALNSIVVASDLLNNTNAPSVYNNKTSMKFLASIPIDVAPGYQIIYTPNFKTKYRLNKDAKFSTIDISVLSDTFEDITMTNVWSLNLVIEYDE